MHAHTHAHTHTHTHTHTHIHTGICMNEGCSKRSKPDPERRTRVEIFSLWQHTTTFYKNRKTNSDFCLNFNVGEVRTKA